MSMFDKRAFFDLVRKGILGPTLDDGEVSGCETILDAMDGQPRSWCAYALGTAYHETAHTMRPIKEHGGPRYYFRMYDIQGQRPAVAKELGNLFPGDGATYAGRGFVQLTGRRNFTKASDKTGYPLVGNPDLAMRPDIAALIVRYGMEEGWFTGKKFAHFLPTTADATHQQFYGARRIINRLDKATLIGDYALEFQTALRGAGW
jgi:putative chitinase